MEEPLFFTTAVEEIVLDDVEYAVTAPTLVTIPPGTKHATRVDEGQRMEYTYINQFAN